MTESQFSNAVTERLALMRRRVLRVSDCKDARHHLYGLRALTLPAIDSTGADLLVLPDAGVRCVLARSWKDVADALAHEGPFFLELKDPFARKRADQKSQEAWMRWVSGGRQ